MKVSLILLIALGVAALLRHRSAALRHWVLAAAIGCAAVMPLLEIALPSWHVPLSGQAVFQPMDAASVRLKPDPTVEKPDPTVERGPTVEKPDPTVEWSVKAAVGSAFRRAMDTFSAWTQGADSSFTMERVSQWIRPIWIAGFAISALVLLVGLGRLGWIAWGSRRLTFGRWVDLADEISRAYGLDRPVVLLQSSHPTLLVTWGFARPRVMLPAAAAEWSEERARVVLSHELAHITRGDWIVYLTAELLRAVYWFNPLLWMVCRRLRLESEHACDDEVISRGIEGTDYATHLVDLARALNQRRHTWLPAPAMARPSSLERRVRAMLNDRLNRSSLTGSTRVVIVAVLLGITGAVAAAQNVYATFSGTVADQQGARIPGVTLVLTNAERQAKYEVKTNQAGSFEFVGLPPGAYQLEVAGLGFRKVSEEIKVAAPGVQRNVVLQIGSLQESITVRFNPADPADPTSSAKPVIKVRRVPDHNECVASAEGGRIVAPRKLKDVAPVYPASLRSAATEGTVVMQGRIGVDGFITDIQVLGEAHPELANAAVEAVRGWEYSPTLLNCVPVEPTITVTTRFMRMQ